MGDSLQPSSRDTGGCRSEVQRLAMLLVCVACASAASLTPGNLLGLRVSRWVARRPFLQRFRGKTCCRATQFAFFARSASTLSTDSTTVLLDELAAGSGSVVQTLTVPDTGSAACTLSGTVVGEGQLTISIDQAVASFACYATASGTAAVSATTSVAAPRAQVNVLPTGVVTAPVTMPSPAYNNRAIYGAVSMSSASDWYAFGPAGASVSPVELGGAEIRVPPIKQTDPCILAFSYYHSYYY
jgi:hypothetical protein